MHDLLHTPRAIKRFVNVYRLIRVGVSEDEYERFAGDRPDAHFRIVALLLAVNTGFPRPAARMLRGLGWPNRLSQADRFTDFADFVKRLDPGAKDPLLAALEFNRRELAQLEPIHRLLTPFVSRVPSDLDVWSRWAREVGRYSMYWRAK